MDTRFDVAVIGGGPAECSTALALARLGYRCLVVEKSDYSNVRVGETFPAAIRRLLVDLGVWERFIASGHAPAHAIHSIWGDRQTQKNDAIFDPYGPGWHVDRVHFDRMLATAAENARVQVLRTARVDSFAAMSDGSWRLEIKCSKLPFVGRAEFLVDASGRRCVVARPLGARRIALDRLIGLVAFFRPYARETLIPQAMLVESVQDGWWYSAPLPDRRIVVAYMTDADLLQKSDGPLLIRFAALLSAAAQTATRLQSYTLDSEPTVSAANSSRLDRMWGDNWVAVGDAAMTVDPLSSQGVYKAMKSGLLAARAIARFSSGDPTALSDHASDLSSEFDGYLPQLQYHYSLEQRWATRNFWRRRHFASVNSTPLYGKACATLLPPSPVLQGKHQST